MNERATAKRGRQEKKKEEVKESEKRLAERSENRDEKTRKWANFGVLNCGEQQFNNNDQLRAHLFTAALFSPSLLRQSRFGEHQGRGLALPGRTKQTNLQRSDRKNILLDAHKSEVFGVACCKKGRRGSGGVAKHALPS